MTDPDRLMCHAAEKRRLLELARSYALKLGSERDHFWGLVIWQPMSSQDPRKQSFSAGAFCSCLCRMLILDGQSALGLNNVRTMRVGLCLQYAVGLFQTGAKSPMNITGCRWHGKRLAPHQTGTDSGRLQRFISSKMFERNDETQRLQVHI